MAAFSAADATPPQIVRAHGLKIRTDLNGCDGLLCGPPLESGRFHVKMVHTQEEVSIHPDNFYMRMQWESDTDWESRMRIRARMDEYERRRNEPKLEDVGGGESKAEDVGGGESKAEDSASAHFYFYYHVLNLTKKASAKDIKKAFHMLSRKLHPDRRGGDREQFEVVRKAYEILSHEKLKKAYDNGGQDAVNLMMEQMRKADQRRTRREQQQADAEAEKVKKAQAKAAKKAEAKPAKQAEAERGGDSESRRSKEEARKREQEAKRAEEKARRAEVEIEKLKADARRAKVEIEKLKADARKREPQAKRAKEEARRAKVEIEKLKADARKREPQAKRAKEEARRAKVEIEKLKADARKREQEAKRASKTSHINALRSVMRSSLIPYLDAVLEKMRNGETEIQYHHAVDASAIIVAEMLPSSKLTKLSLSKITNVGVMKLAEMLPSSKLTWLSLEGSQITDAGAIKLAEMLPSSNLTYLNLRRYGCDEWYNYPIGDSGATKLAEMLPSSKLTHLDLTDHCIAENHTLWNAFKRNKYGVEIEIVGKRSHE